MPVDTKGADTRCDDEVLKGTTVLDLDNLLRESVRLEASDVHIKVGSPPFLRVDGHLQPWDSEPRHPGGHRARSRSHCCPRPAPTSSSITTKPTSRTRSPGSDASACNVFRQRGSVGLVLRRVLPGIPSMEELGLPPICRRLAEEQRGLVLVTGPTGSGKTTTLAAMIDHINEHQARHIVTVEDPIEVLHPDKRSIVNQREIGTDTDDFHNALEARAAPGPRRDPHRRDARPRDRVGRALRRGDRAPRSLDAAHDGRGRDDHADHRLLPPFQQQQVRMSVATSLKGIISQRLLERADRQGRVPAMEVLVNTGRVFDKIADADADPRDRGDHRRRRVLRHADLRPGTAQPLRAGDREPARRAGQRVEPRTTSG